MEEEEEEEEQEDLILKGNNGGKGRLDSGLVADQYGVVRRGGAGSAPPPPYPRFTPRFPGRLDKSRHQHSLLLSCSLQSVNYPSRTKSWQEVP